MSLTAQYDAGTNGQISGIRKFAKNAIIVIWLAGISAVLIFIIYFRFIVVNESHPGKLGFEGVDESPHYRDAIVFSDKTALVNIGLRIQAISGNEDEKENGSISIHKLNYDRQVKKATRLVKPAFTVKAVPK